MDKQPETPRKGLRSLFKRKQNESPNKPAPANSDDPSGGNTVKGQSMGSLDHDTSRTYARHQKACELLLACLPKSQQDHTWRFLDLSSLESKAATFDDEFSQKVNAILDSKRGQIKDDDSWAKYCQTVECIFAALIPFSKNFLSVANQGQSVRPI
jgi:hypothetical protein